MIAFAGHASTRCRKQMSSSFYDMRLWEVSCESLAHIEIVF